MRAQLLIGQGMPLEERIVDEPVPKPGQTLLRVLACAVCRTDLHVVDGELRIPSCH